MPGPKPDRGRHEPRQFLSSAGRGRVMAGGGTLPGSGWWGPRPPPARPDGLLGQADGAGDRVLTAEDGAGGVQAVDDQQNPLGHAGSIAQPGPGGEAAI